MKKLLATVAACLLTAACTTTNTKIMANPVKPPPGARILLVEPDVQLALLTAAGIQEPRADWSAAGKANVGAEVEKALKGRSHTYKALDPDEAMAGRVGQLLRLNEAVVTSVQYFSFLPTKKESFDWTLGEGAQAIGAAYEGDYALFVTSRGSWSSGGRYVAFIAVAAVGGAIPMGGQSATASLVDLKTGRIVWHNSAYAAAGMDMRTPEGAAGLVQALLKDLPL